MFTRALCTVSTLTLNTLSRFTQESMSPWRFKIITFYVDQNSAIFHNRCETSYISMQNVCLSETNVLPAGTRDIDQGDSTHGTSECRL